MTFNRRTVSLASLAIVLFALFGYGLFEARRLIAGPELSLDAPQDGSATSSPAVTLSGTARNIAFLSINGKQAYTDTDGRFAETFSPAPGYTVVTVAAKDRFGRQVSKTVHFTALNYCSLL